MSLHPEVCSLVPEETSRVARAAFPKGSLCLHADAAGLSLTDPGFDHTVLSEVRSRLRRVARKIDSQPVRAAQQ
jgi:hypothetical protein